MPDPRPLRRDKRVFISAVTAELGTVRALVKEGLLAIGIHPIEMTDFPLTHLEVEAKLREILASCDAVVHIAGHCYGSEPANLPAGAPRRSFTQMEYHAARELGLPVYVFVTGAGFPADACPAEPTDKRALQEAHRQLVTQDRDHFVAGTRGELKDKVLTLKVKLESLERELTQVDEKLDRHAADLGGKLQTLSTDLQRMEAKLDVARNMQRQYVSRFLQKMASDPKLTTEEVRQRAIAELPEYTGLTAAEVEEIIEEVSPKMAADKKATPLDRANAAFAAGDYETVFREAAAQTRQTRDLAKVEGAAALAEFRNHPSPKWHDQAVAAFGRALALTSEKEEPKEWVEVANSLALIHLERAAYMEAEPLMRRALAIDEASYGKEHPRVAILLNNLAALLQATNRLADAEPLMRRALAIDEASYGKDHPTVAIRLNNLAQLLQATNRLGEAEPLMRRALAIEEASCGKDHPDVAIALNNLARLFLSTDRLADAEPLMRRSLEIREKAWGPKHSSTANGLAGLAQVQWDSGKEGDAEALARRAKEIWLEGETPNDPRLGKAYRVLGLSEAKRGNQKAARAHFGEALRLLKMNVATYSDEIRAVEKAMRELPE